MLGLYATVGRDVFPVESWEQVSRAYRRLVDHLGLGASQAPPCRIINDDGITVATVSYNGRVWRGIDGYVEGAAPIYDPRH